MKIVTENLSKRFSREWIFKDFLFTFEDTQTYAIVGPNGSGKSTLLQIIWGQLPPTNGLVKYTEGVNSISSEDIFRHIAIATPYMEVIDEFSLEEMIDFQEFRKKIPLSFASRSRRYNECNYVFPESG